MRVPICFEYSARPAYQNLYSKLYKISGITISEDDNVFSAMLYNVEPHTQLVAVFFAGRIVIYRSKIIRMKCSLN